MEVEFVVGGTCPLLDGAVEPIYIWGVLDLGSGVDTNIKEGQFNAG